MYDNLLHNRLIDCNVCLLLPSYNNAKTLPTLLDALLAITNRIIVINDGSTDATRLILKRYSEKIQVVDYEKNRGKGYALRQGFAVALQLGYRYVLSMDTDGQHRPEDIAIFLDELEQHPETLIVGSRSLKQANKPGGNTFANRFSNFWFCVQTGRSFPDTQSGFRLYPLAVMQQMWLITNRYESELEMLVKAAWRGVELRAIPIEVIYADDRVTHFRPFRDFFRISVLNTVFVFGAVLYGYPSMFFRKSK